MTSKLTITDERVISVIERLEHYACNLKWTNVRGAQDLLTAADGLRELQERRKAAMDSEPVAALKLPPKLSNDRERAHELNTGVDIWNRCIDEVAKINGEMIIAGRVDGLHPSTMALVNDFATALAEKLHKAELKYGYSNAWINNGWMTECLAEFHRHIAKGDPRDVAAYCAFMWYHGWKTEAAQPAPVVPETAHSSVIAEQLAHALSGLKVTDHQRAVISCAVDRLNNVAQLLHLSPSALLVPEILDYQGAKELYNYLMTEEETNATVNGWNACRAAMLNGGKP